MRLLFDHIVASADTYISAHLTEDPAASCEKAPSWVLGASMSTAKQKTAARRDVKKAVAAAKRQKTISHLSKATRTALGKQGAKVAQEHRRDH